MKIVLDRILGGELMHQHEQGIKYRLQSSDVFVIGGCYQYNIHGEFILDAGASFTLESGAELNLMEI